MVYSSSTVPKATVLIVDDEEDIRRLLTVVLNENNYDADACETGREAIEKSNEKFYDIALIDIFLSDMSGVELLTKMRKRKPRTRKIIITGNPSLQNAVEALNKGADAYLMKPLDIERMLATLEDQIKAQKEEREAAMESFAGGRLRGRLEILRESHI